MSRSLSDHTDIHTADGCSSRTTKTSAVIKAVNTGKMSQAQSNMLKATSRPIPAIFGNKSKETEFLYAVLFT